MPAWEDISPYTEQQTRTHRFSWTNLLILVNIAGFVVMGFSTKNGRDDALAFLQFDKASAISRLELWQFVTYSFFHVIEPKYIVWMIVGIYTLYTVGNELEAEIGAARYVTLYFAFAAYGALAHALLQYFVPAMAPNYALGRASNLCAPVLGLAHIAALRWPRRPVLFFFFLPMRLRTALVLLALSWIAYASFWFPQGLGPSFGGLAAALAVAALEPSLDRAFDRAAVRHDRNAFLEEVDVRRRTDEILDKITRHGIGSLTRTERRTLKQASALMRRGKERAHE